KKGKRGKGERGKALPSYTCLLPFRHFAVSPFPPISLLWQYLITFGYVIVGPVLYLFLLLFLYAGVGSVHAQTSTVPDHPSALFQRLLTSIRQIQILDNHAHPAFPGDPEMDALTFEAGRLAALEPFALPL